MEELFEMLLQMCLSEESISLEVACAVIGLNYDKIVQYATEDHDAQTVLKLCCSMLRNNIHAKFYQGDLAKNEADNLIADLDDVIAIYLSTPVQPPVEE